MGTFMNRSSGAGVNGTASPASHRDVCRLSSQLACQPMQPSSSSYCGRVADRDLLPGLGRDLLITSIVAWPQPGAKHLVKPTS